VLLLRSRTIGCPASLPATASSDWKTHTTATQAITASRAALPLPAPSSLPTRVLTLHSAHAPAAAHQARDQGRMLQQQQVGREGRLAAGTAAWLPPHTAQRPAQHAAHLLPYARAAM
jgi:hypothetical protein